MNPRFLYANRLTKWTSTTSAIRVLKSITIAVIQVIIMVMIAIYKLDFVLNLSQVRLLKKYQLLVFYKNLTAF